MDTGPQKRLASWTLTVAGSSIILPFIALIALVGIASISAFSIGCAAIVAAFVFLYKSFQKLPSSSPKKRIRAWSIGLAYFALVLGLVAFSMESFEVAAILGFAECVGLLLCTIGLIEALKINRDANQQLDSIGTSSAGPDRVS